MVHAEYCILHIRLGPGRSGQRFLYAQSNSPMACKISAQEFSSARQLFTAYFRSALDNTSNQFGTYVCSQVEAGDAKRLKLCAFDKCL